MIQFTLESRLVAASALIQLSISCEEKLLGQVIKFVQNPFVFAKISVGDVRGLSELVGMNLYTKESYLRDRYGATVSRRGGKLVILSPSRKPVWEVDEDCLSTSEGRFWRDLSIQSSSSTNFATPSISGADSVNNIERVFNNVDFEGVESTLLEYLKQHQSSDHDKLAETLKDLPRDANNEVLPPKNVPIEQLYKWGHFINTMAHIFTDFRNKNHMVPIPGKFENHPIKTAKTNVVMADWDPAVHAVPVNSEKFADWEVRSSEGCKLQLME